MAYQVGDMVLVPSSMLENGDDYPFALHRTTVTEVAARSIKVTQSDGSASAFIATSKCHKNIGICIINVGDNATEAALLDPLAKSLLQFCRLLMSDDYIRLLKVRSLAELELVWRPNAAAYSHVLLVGHGSGTEFKFAVDGWVGPARLLQSCGSQ
ncbi:hypothetical protein HFN80_01295 [Rhizobium laguerreae]|uniref:hypothetical protein n=1 Tax=Rhizobium laguerreae TaxID=1076926 RepID=UPI001C917375|nr:hypothetical protein [Rhizobium laguerreae]MBY3462669.1 hypothetical protein [Rhizobium laguerreae]